MTVRKLGRFAGGIAIIALAAVVGLGCFSHAAEEAKMEESLGNVTLSDPALDVARELRQGDRRFIGIYGYTLTTLGVRHYSSIVQLHGVKPVEGTSDAIFGAQQARLQDVACEYAVKYNRILLL